MEKKFSKQTLSRDYYLFTLLVALVVVGITGWRAWTTYDWLQQDRLYRYAAESDRVAASLQESFSYVENFMHFMGEKIVLEGDNSPKNVASVLLLHKADRDIMAGTQSLFDFVNPDGLVIATSSKGALKSPLKKVTVEQRTWIVEAPKHPWKAHLSKPAIGIMSGELIIPMGFGITDKHDKFLGILTMGFNVQKLLQKLEKALSEPSTGFILLTKNFEIVVEPTDNKIKVSDNFFKEKLSYTNNYSGDAGRLNEPIEIGNMRYTFFRNTYRYPFIILIGDNKHYLDKEFRDTVIPRVEQSIYIGILFIILLYFFQRTIIKPVTSLSDAAVKLSKGETDIRLPVSTTYEYNVLADQLRRIAEFIIELRETRNELEVALNVKSTFLSSMTHELRTPLNAVIGFSDLMKQKRFGELNEHYTDYIEYINSSGQYLLSLIEQVLDASKFEAGMMVLHEGAINVRYLINDAVKNIEPRAAQVNITVTVEVHTPLPYLYADSVKVKQAVLNLLSNAVKFTPRGGDITVAVKVEETFIITVKDTGIGIAKEDIPIVLERFGQAHNEHTTDIKGTGLGMSITQDIMLLHGGRMEIESELGVGTTVSLIFPKERIQNGE